MADPVKRNDVPELRTMREVRQALQAHQEGDDLLHNAVREDLAGVRGTLAKVAWLGIGTLATAGVELLLRVLPHA